MVQVSQLKTDGFRKGSSPIALGFVSLVISFFAFVAFMVALVILFDALSETENYVDDYLRIAFIVAGVVGFLWSILTGILAARFLERRFGVSIWLRNIVKIDFSGKIGRIKFLIRQVLGLVIVFASIFIAVFFESALLTLLLMSINIIILIKYLIVTTAQRTRSLGLNPWMALVLLVPVVNFPFYIFLLAGPEGAARSMREE